MRILIDECLDWRLRRSFTYHFCRTVRDRGWSGITNGALLRQAQEEFDLFITGDLNLQFQQNLGAINLAIVVLVAKSTRLKDTEPLMAKVLSVLDQLEPGTVTRIS